MKLFGRELSLARGKTASPPAEQRGVSPISASVSTRSWRSPLGISFDNYVPGTVDLAVYKLLACALPFVDRALRQLSRMIVPFAVVCDNEATADAINLWLKDGVVVDDLFRGFNAFARPYVRQSLQYGKSAGEIVLSQSKRDIEGLCIIDAPRIRIIPSDNGLLLGEEGPFGQVKPYEQQELFVYSALNKEGDNPHGVSLLRSIPFVADCVLRMEQATRQMWQRSGAPSFFIHYQVDPSVTIADADLSSRRQTIEDDWYSSQVSRWNGEGIQDFVAASQGTITFEAIGADVKELNFEVPYRAMIEQIISTVELAPFMLGIQWSTTERLSQQQADSIIGYIDDTRSELEADFLHIIDWYQRVQGLRGAVSIEWADVNLQDSVETAKAQYTEAQAQKATQDAALQAWANGFIDQEQAAELCGFEGGVKMPLDAPVTGSAGGSDMAGQDAVMAAIWRNFP